MTSEAVPLTILTGFLGAGKTTVLNRLLAGDHGLRIAVLVNDFGEVDIDGRLLESSTDDVLTLANGCICCSLSDGFAETLDTVRSFAERIDRVVVEVSGVGQPDKVAQWAHSPGFSPDGIVVVVNPLSVRELSVDRYVGDTVLAQLACADLVVLTRTDVAEPTELGQIEQWLRGATNATLLRTPVPTGVLLGPLARVDQPTANAEPDHKRGEAPTDHVTVSRRLHGPVSRASINTWVQARPWGVVRAKGLLRVDDRPGDRTVLQVCGSSTAVSVDGPWDGGDDAVVAIALPGTPRAALVKWLNLLR